jgi:hypothetical protein
LVECYASDKHVVTKIQCLLKQGELKEALTFARLQAEKTYFSTSSIVLEWFGRTLLYIGKENEGRSVLKRALDLTETQESIKDVIRNIRKAKEIKDEASSLFKSGSLQRAIEKFRECLSLDEYNV